LGHSFGGWIALELAQRLREEGAEVASLTIVDSRAPAEAGAQARPFGHAATLAELVKLYQLRLP
jgi:thioesterase domain-containing protein